MSAQVTTARRLTFLFLALVDAAPANVPVTRVHEHQTAPGGKRTAVRRLQDEHPGFSNDCVFADDVGYEDCFENGLELLNAGGEEAFDSDYYGANIWNAQTQSSNGVCQLIVKDDDPTVIENVMFVADTTECNDLYKRCFCQTVTDNCPNDPYKTEPGLCGCGTEDLDTDGDGTPDCEDPCPNNADPECTPIVD